VAVGADTLITIGADSILLVNFPLASLDVTDFFLAA
jgi:hypothetical protein